MSSIGDEARASVPSAKHVQRTAEQIAYERAIRNVRAFRIWRNECRRLAKRCSHRRLGELLGVHPATATKYLRGAARRWMHPNYKGSSLQVVALRYRGWSEQDIADSQR